MKTLGMVTMVAALTAACSKSPTSPTGGSTGNSRTVSSVTVAGATSVSEGETSQLTATAQYSDSTSETVTNQASWTSSDTSVATVSATGLVTALRTGSVDITATFQSIAGRRTVAVDAARFSLRVQLDGFTALDTCDDVTQGLTQGEFATRIAAVLADGSTFTMYETTDYPGNASGPRGHNLARGGTVNLTNSRTFSLTGAAGQFVRIMFRATEWDEQIVIIPPSIRWIRDDSMNDRSTTRTHSYGSGTWSSLGPNTLTLGASGCQVRLNYNVTATRQ